MAVDDAGAADGAEDVAGPAVDLEPGEAPEPASEPVTGPDGSVVDAAYEDFLRRFEEDGGGEPSS